MISSFIFNGKSSRDFGLKVEQLPASVHPTRRGDPYRIAGRNGTRRREDGTYENYTQPYNIWFRDFTTNRDVYQVSHDIAAWLIGSSDYCRFEDTYEPEYYRLACFSGPLNIEAVLRKFGRAQLEFDFQPEYFLKTGEKPVTVMENVAVQSDNVSLVLHNPTGQTAHPLFRLAADGGVGFEVVSSAGTFTVTATTGESRTILFDCDTYAVTYADGTSAAAAVQYLDARDYPTLPSFGAGDITIRNMTLSTSGVIEKLEVIPRWWSL